MKAQTLVYENNAGGLRLVYTHNNDVYVHVYRMWETDAMYRSITGGRVCADDVRAILKGADPIVDGWEGNQHGELVDDVAGDDVVFNSNLGVTDEDPDRFSGFSGREFWRALSGKKVNEDW